MEIEKRRFNATDEEVTAEICRIVFALRSAGIVPFISKLKTELKCSEGDLAEFLLRNSEAFEIVHISKGKPGIRISPAFEMRMKQTAAAKERGSTYRKSK